MAKRIKIDPSAAFAVVHGDCDNVLLQNVNPLGTPRLGIIDPPYNIGVEYEAYDDDRPQSEYIKWLTHRVMRTVNGMTDDASIWVLINAFNVSELDVSLKKEGLYPRAKVPWYFTFGQHHYRALTQAHATCLYYSVHKSRYVFNDQDPAIRIPSQRQLVYNDKRANPKGRLPDNVWILNPAQLEKGFDPLHDCWTFSRVCGTFNAKRTVNKNQLPIPMLERIIRLCSDPGDVVIDSFMGTGTTGKAALNTGRRFFGIDVSASCVADAEEQLLSLHQSLQQPALPAKARKAK